MVAEQQTHSTEELQHAFALFNDIAGALQQAYTTLEQRTQALRDELSQVEAKRQDERQRTRQVKHKLENLLQCLPGGVVLLDSHGYVEDCNPAALDFLGAPLVDELWLDVIDRAFSPRIDDGHEISLRDGRRMSLATRSLNDGIEGAQPGQLILLTDLTETRKLQDKLHHNERLIEMGRMMAALAHQLRTPLASATLYANHLCSEELDSPRSRRFASKVVTQLNAIEQQIRDMLVFARADLPITERVSLASLLAGLQEVMHASVSANGASCSITSDCDDEQIVCNREVLIGALMNLVTNALQAQPQAQIEIVASYAANDSISLGIKDNGPGFKVGEQRMFSSSKPHGTGLGLAVVHAVVAAHQGRFELQSEPGRGTFAQVILPVVPASKRT